MPTPTMMDDENLARLPEGLHRIRRGDGGPAIAKVRRGAATGFFKAEARGLATIRDTRAFRVPDVFAVSPHGILMEDLGAGRPSRDDWERAGAHLAQMHRCNGESFGFDSDGWCGESPQDNTRSAGGHAFFVERRLHPQARRARLHGLLDENDVRDLDRICGRLGDLIPAAPAVLVHGDLWTANLHACANGELALIDAAAAHHGWAETDLAMLTLFGEPPASFFAAYETQAETNSEWRERAPIYNLYHLLNHLNLFGGGYLASVRAILSRYG
ncbi:MAG TPA: fructosamine kinase family protein [Rhodanobacteraceae bacterium]|nr:fructosamine kinase family protein [Rhodanobacteraceae bacterium]